MTGQEGIIEAIRQMIEGEDYTPLERLMADLTPEQATQKPVRSPYSIATVVWHTWFWVNLWVHEVRGTEDALGVYTPGADWRDISAGEWETMRERMLESLQQARALAATEDLARKTRQDQTVGQNLLQIAIHTAYHIGQVTLLRLELGLWPPAGGE